MTDSQAYYHGTKADLKVGDLIAPGHASNGIVLDYPDLFRRVT